MSLRAWRKRRVWSAADLAANAQVSKVTVLHVENARLRPQYRTIRKISAAVGVEPMDVAEFRRVLGGDDGDGR